MLQCIALGIYLFGMVYSPGEGPVPFTYSAEAYPLYIRPLGMSLATATTWFFNFVLSVTWPSLLQAFKPQGAFGWYAGWNIIGFFLVSTALFPQGNMYTWVSLSLWADLCQYYRSFSSCQRPRKRHLKSWMRSLMCLCECTPNMDVSGCKATFSFVSDPEDWYL